MFKNLSQLKQFLKENIGIEYTVINYNFKSKQKRKLSIVQSKSFAGQILDQNHPNYGQNSWSDFPKASDIKFTENGFIIYFLGVMELEYIFPVKRWFHDLKNNSRIIEHN